MEIRIHRDPLEDPQSERYCSTGKEADNLCPCDTLQDCVGKNVAIVDSTGAGSIAPSVNRCQISQT